MPKRGMNLNSLIVQEIKMTLLILKKKKKIYLQFLKAKNAFLIFIERFLKMQMMF